MIRNNLIRPRRIPPRYGGVDECEKRICSGDVAERAKPSCCDMADNPAKLPNESFGAKQGKTKRYHGFARVDSMYQRNIFLRVLLIAVIFYFAGCATAPRRTPRVKGKDVQLKEICQKYNILWDWDSVTQVITLRFNGKLAKLLVGSDIVLIDEKTVTLSRPVRTRRSSIIVPADFREKVIAQMRQVSKRPPTGFYYKAQKIIIDAGHGGKDPGAIGPSGIHEKTVVLDIAKRVGKILESKGMEVIMTRDSDEFITLQRRTEITCEADADLFVSIHANSSPSKSISGIEVYMLSDLSDLDKEEAQRKSNRHLLFQNFNIKRPDDSVERIVDDLLYDNKQLESEKFAGFVAGEISKYTKAKNRGAKQSRFFVLRNTLIPAILIEVGFLTNPKEERLLKTGQYRQEMAKGIAQSILDYANK